MREFRFNPDSKTPLVQALVVGPKAVRRIRLIFDSGAEHTQIHTKVMNYIGYTKDNSIATAVVSGATGDEQEGFIIRTEKLIVLGRKFTDLSIASFDFSHLTSRFNIDGLLGYDLIRLLHFEMNGPKGILKIY